METLSFKKKLIAFSFVIFSFNLFCLSATWSLDYPTKPIELYVIGPPGGPADSSNRILAELGSKELGVPVVIINKVGIGGALAASLVAKEKPDGYTILSAVTATFTSNFAFYPDLTYKTSDFVPLFRTMLGPVVVAVRADSPYKSLKDVIDGGKKNPGKLRSVSGSPSISLVWLGLLKDQGVDMVHMVLKGAPPALVSLLGGHCEIFVDSLVPMVPHIEAGKIRVLAAIGSQRLRKVPDIPTLKELGYSNFARDFWHGWFAPAGTPQPIVEKLTQVYKKILSLPEVQANYDKFSGVASFMGPEEFASFVDDQYKFYMKLSKEIKF